MRALGLGIGTPFGGSRFVSPILSEFDFSSQSPGFVSSIPGLVYQCASSSRTVQTADSAVVSGGGVDAVPIGRLLSSGTLGLVLDGPAVNSVVGTPGESGWTNTTDVVTTETGPDGVALAYLHDDQSAATAASSARLFRNVWAASTTYIGSAFVRKVSTSSESNTINFRAAFAAIAGLQVHSALSASYKRCQISYSSGAGGQNQALFAPTGTALSGPLGKIGVWGWNLHAGPFSSEYYDGTRLGAALGLDFALCVKSGRIGCEIAWYPRGASNAYGTVYLWYVDSNNYVTYSGSTSRITVVINGVSYSPTETVTWTSPTYTSNILTELRLVRLWIEAGGSSLVTRVQAKIDSSANITTTDSASPQASITGSGNVSVASRLDDKTQYQMAGHLTALRFYRPGKRPSWVV